MSIYLDCSFASFLTRRNCRFFEPEHNLTFQYPLPSPGSRRLSIQPRLSIETKSTRPSITPPDLALCTSLRFRLYSQFQSQLPLRQNHLQQLVPHTSNFSTTDRSQSLDLRHPIPPTNPHEVPIAPNATRNDPFSLSYHSFTFPLISRPSLHLVIFCCYSGY